MAISSHKQLKVHRPHHFFIAFVRCLYSKFAHCVGQRDVCSLDFFKTASPQSTTDKFGGQSSDRLDCFGFLG